MLLSLPSAARFILDSLKKRPRETPAAKPPGDHTGDPPPTLQPPLFQALETSPE